MFSGDSLPRRIKLILFFPIFVLIFMLGWALYVIGDSQARGNTGSLKHNIDRDQEKHTDAELRMGLIEEVFEDDING